MSKNNPVVLKTSQFFQLFARYNISWFAAACAFFTLFSLVPIVVLVGSLLPLTSLTEEMVFTYVADYLPDSMEELIHYIVEDVYSPNVALFSLSIVATVWSSSKAFSAIIRGMEAIYEKPRYVNYVRRRLIGVLYTVLFIVAILLTVSIGVLSERLKTRVLEWIPRMDAAFAFLLKFKFLILIFFLTLVFMLIYKSLPDVTVPFLRQAPGAVFAAASWVLFARLFPTFIRYTSNYGTYGTLGTFMVAMLWMYYSMYFILFGACLNRFWNGPGEIVEESSHLMRTLRKKAGKESK